VTPLPDGLLFPESVLSSGWFTLLATVVALNTIIYVGLTLAKVIPWPRQFHPRRVRSALDRVGVHVNEESAMKDIPTPYVIDADSPYERLRQQFARREIPQAFAFTGGVAIVFAVMSLIVVDRSSEAIFVGELATGVLFLFGSVALGYRRFRGRTLMWIWAASSTVLVLLLAVEGYVLDSPLPLSYSFIVIASFMPVTLAWRPALAAVVVMIIGIGVAGAVIAGPDDVRIVITAMLAALVGAMVLRLRLVSIDALADEEARSEALATTDPLTGALTRRGLLTLVPGLASTGQRNQQEVCVIYVDVNGLQRANDDYGLGYGDDVLRAVSTVLRGQVRTGDLVARWSGDEFLVTGLGDRPDPVSLAERLNEALRLTGVALGKWPITVRVGTAAGQPADTTFEALLAEAAAISAPAGGQEAIPEPS